MEMIVWRDLLTQRDCRARSVEGKQGSETLF
jgi:hypothetical protein